MQTLKTDSEKSSVDRLLSFKDAARLTGLAESTFRAWRYYGKIPVVRLGRVVRIKETDLNEIIRKGTEPAKRQRS